jgi:hypothetical protein
MCSTREVRAVPSVHEWVTNGVESAILTGKQTGQQAC